MGSCRRRIVSVSEFSSLRSYRFPPDVIILAIRWYLRYGLSYRDVEELLAERGITVDHGHCCIKRTRAFADCRSAAKVPIWAAQNLAVCPVCTRDLHRAPDRPRESVQFQSVHAPAW